ncbi:MAG: cytochrome c3 family protein [Deltaproteobacteria bacterium]|nr:cytochrome c3 family protein [Deltaproteobacteria bacterium]
MKLWLQICLIVFVIFTAIYVGSQGSEGHAKFNIACADCHIALPKDGDSPKDMTFLKGVSLLCLDCHDMAKKASHPVGLKPTMEVAQYLPLDWQKRITCITCHVVHKGGYGRYFLRSERRGKGFCMICHGKNLESGIGMHKGMVESAHFGSRYTVEDAGVIIDEVSIQCLSCHDGQLASNVSVDKLGSGTFEHSSEVGVSHPIGIDYRKAASIDKTLIQPMLLPKEIKLFAGKIGCGSCHNPYSDRHSQMVMGNNRSALCFACHIK